MPYFPPPKTNKGKLVLSFFCLIAGILIIVSILGVHDEVAREDAVPYTGVYIEYKTDKNSFRVCFEDGSEYKVYDKIVTTDIYNRFDEIPKGETLSILINPNNEYVIEIKSPTREIINFNESQDAMQRYDKSYLAIGAFMIVVSLASIAIVCFNIIRERKSRRL